MSKILVTYATMAGSTAEVAQAIGEELQNHGQQVDVLPLDEINDLQPYQAVVLGAPMIMGWHRGATHFLKKHRADFQRIPLAVFVLAMSLTESGETSVDGVPVFIDENLPKPPKAAGKLSFRERYAQLSNYLTPIIQATRPSKPVSIGLFGGRLEYGRLKWWAMLFVLLIIQAPVGDRRNWERIRAWAGALPEALRLG